MLMMYTGRVMRCKAGLVGGLILACGPALAQVPPGAPPLPSAAPSLEQLVKERLGQDALNGLACTATTGTLRAQLEAAQARVKELEAAATGKK